MFLHNLLQSESLKFKVVDFDKFENSVLSKLSHLSQISLYQKREFKYWFQKKKKKNNLLKCAVTAASL